MTRTSTRFRPARIAVAAALAAGGLWISFGAQAATALSAAERSEVQATYRSDRAACVAGNTWQDRDSCLREAVAARRAALRGEFASLPEAQYQANATLRCDALPAESRTDCSLRMGSDGVVIGSVESGAVVRELPPAVVAARSAAADTPTTIAMAAPAPAAAAEVSSGSNTSSAAEPTAAAAADSTRLAPMDAATVIATEPTTSASTAMSAEAATTVADSSAAVSITPPLGESLSAGERVVEPTQHPALEPATAVEAPAEIGAVEPARVSEEATVDPLGVNTPGLLNGPR